MIDNSLINYSHVRRRNNILMKKKNQLKKKYRQEKNIAQNHSEKKEKPKITSRKSILTYPNRSRMILDAFLYLMMLFNNI